DQRQTGLRAIPPLLRARRLRRARPHPGLLQARRRLPDLLQCSASRRLPLSVLTLASARFDCTFGRGCEGACCRNGRPPVYTDEAHRLDVNIARIWPLLWAEARAVVSRDGYVSRRLKAGQPTARVVAGWCVFFNQGCALHQ